LGEEGDQAVFSFASPLGYTYPPPFTRYGNFMRYTRYPYTTIGVLFFKQYGVSYRCSASSIGNYAIWTTGHCTHAGDNSSSGWSYDVVFIPAYNSGAAPYGQWSAANLIVSTSWYTSGNLANDVGGAILYTLGGWKISQRVGWLGFAYNQSSNLHWTDIAYPSVLPFSGKYQQICAASYAYSYTAVGTPYPTGIGCDMTGGSSGGPWIYKFSGNAGATNYLNGHNDFRRTGYPQEMFSPYFGTTAYNTWYALVNTAP
jgi:V8-like Glu-specific endopeptidase